MPTIDELAPATAAADSDEFPVNQNSITRKITRAQILAGVQTQLSIPGGSLVGRATPGMGSMETISVGNYLSLASGTLSAMAAPYDSLIARRSGSGSLRSCTTRAERSQRFRFLQFLSSRSVCDSEHRWQTTDSQADW